MKLLEAEEWGALWLVKNRCEFLYDHFCDRVHCWNIHENICFYICNSKNVKGRPFSSFRISTFYINYLVILPSDLNLETGDVAESICGEEERLCPPPVQLNVETFLPRVDDAEARLWLPMNVLVSGRSLGAILSTYIQ